MSSYGNLIRLRSLRKKDAPADRPKKPYRRKLRSESFNASLPEHVEKDRTGDIGKAVMRARLDLLHHGCLSADLDERAVERLVAWGKRQERLRLGRLKRRRRLNPVKPESPAKG